MYREHTPLQSYWIAGRTVVVKRDDLYAKAPAPPLAKLRGMRSILANAAACGVSIVGCFEARVSSIGHALAAAVQDFPGIHAIVVHSDSGVKRPSLCAAAALGAELVQIPPNYLNVCHAKARDLLAARGGYLLPFGLECREAVDAVAAEARTLPCDIVAHGTIVVCCGSGVTLAGLARGIRVGPHRLVGVSCGRSAVRITACLRRLLGGIPRMIEVHPPPLRYDQQALVECPFPCHPHYDLKAWMHLLRNHERYQDPLVFWNVGA
jgi:1-aminocyclopropane-1-carboxylate deaminase/D-cysteine desulfhydrase-like pyridoxal-dependent ACC family enzyme